MTRSTSKVFIIFQNNEESRPVVDAIEADNPEANTIYAPGFVRIEAPGHLRVRKETIEAQTGGPYDLQQIHINLISLSGNVDESDEELSLTWHD